MKKSLTINFIFATILWFGGMLLFEHIFIHTPRFDNIINKINYTLSILVGTLWCLICYNIEISKKLHQTINTLEINVEKCNDLEEAQNYLKELNSLWKLAHHKDSIGHLFYIKGVLLTKINILKNENN
jgi:hypothetical protein